MGKDNIIKRGLDIKTANLRATNDEKRTIEGYAVVFNERSHTLIDWSIYKYVEEVIAPGAITQELLDRSDVIANLEHCNGNLLARATNGEGSLELKIDSKGLYMRFNAPNTPCGQQAYEGVKRGDYRGMSFAYWNDDDVTNVTYTKEEADDGTKTIVRTVNTIDHICDVAIVLHPAYEQTSVNARSMEDMIEKKFPKEPIKAERSEDMKKEYDELKKLSRDKIF